MAWTYSKKTLAALEAELVRVSDHWDELELVPRKVRNRAWQAAWDQARSDYGHLKYAIEDCRLALWRRSLRKPS